MRLSKLGGNAGAGILAQVGFVIYLLAEIADEVIVGPYTVYADAGLVLLLVYGALIWLCWHNQPLAFLGSSALSVVFILVIAGTFPASEPPLLIWKTVLATIILVIVALEGVVSYAELRGHQP